MIAISLADGPRQSVRPWASVHWLGSNGDDMKLSGWDSFLWRLHIARRQTMSHDWSSCLPEDQMLKNGVRRLAKTVALLMSILVPGITVPASAETIVLKQTTYFSISGTTAADLDREMMRRGPISSVTGHRHPGATRIKFKGSATFITKGNSCRVGGAKVMLSTRLMLPRWTNRRKAGGNLALIWDTLSADIKRHEERHAEIARNHARALEKAILALPPARSCAPLKAKVDKISQQAMTAHDKDQARFDRVEAANFENRLIRLLKYRIESRKGQ
jgi:predicted secreted Zn-dependent protease